MLAIVRCPGPGPRGGRGDRRRVRPRPRPRLRSAARRRRSPPSPPPLPAWAWCPTAARPSPCPGSWASVRRSGCCWPGRRSTPPARRPSGWWTRSCGPARIDAEVAALVQRLTAGATSSVRAIKRLVRAQEVGALEQVLSAEGAAQLQALQGPEFRRRLEAFAARLAPAPRARERTGGRRIFRPGPARRAKWPWSPAAGPGIGLGIASCLAAAGATVAIASRKPEHLEPAAAELRARGRAGDDRRDQRPRARGRGPHGGAGRRASTAGSTSWSTTRPATSTRRRPPSRPTPGAPWSRPISTAASTARRRSTPS